MATTQLRADQVQSFYAGFAGCTDLAAFLRSTCSETIVWENYLPANVPFGGKFAGTQAVSGFLARMMQSIRIEAFRIDRILIDGSSAVVCGFESSSVPATGKRYEMDWVHVLTFGERGALEHVREYNDTAAMAEAFSADARA